MKVKQFICIAILIFISTSSVTYAEAKFSNLYIFGDSLSDTGNLAVINFGAQGPLDPAMSPPPYFSFRASNGLLAVDVFADLLGFDARAYFDAAPDAAPGSNYAVAGARARNKEGEDRPIDLNSQVGLFIQTHILLGGAPSDALYVVMIGGNDVRDARDKLITHERHAARRIIHDAVGAIMQNIEVLYQAGARRFYVVNSPNIGVIPDTSIEGSHRIVHETTKLTRHFNKQLARAVRKFERRTDLDVMTFDLYHFSNHLNENYRSLGLLNRTDPCYVDLSPLNPYFGAPLCNNENGGTIDQYVFFDDIHPTAFIHERIGQAMYSSVPVAQ